MKFSDTLIIVGFIMITISAIFTFSILFSQPPFPITQLEEISVGGIFTGLLIFGAGQTLGVEE